MPDRPICPTCNTKKILLLPVGGGPRTTYQCLVCDKDDPLNKPRVIGWLSPPHLKKPRKKISRLRRLVRRKFADNPRKLDQFAFAFSRGRRLVAYSIFKPWIRKEAPQLASETRPNC